MSYETLGKRLRRLRGQTTQIDIAKAIGIDNSVYSRIESDDKKKIDPDVIRKLAEYHGVSTDYLLGKKNENDKKNYYDLSPKDERDIAKEVERIMLSLDSDNGLAFDGEPLTDEDRQLLRISLENSLRMAREMAKKKFTPKKYRKDK